MPDSITQGAPSIGIKGRHTVMVKERVLAPKSTIQALDFLVQINWKSEVRIKWTVSCPCGVTQGAVVDSLKLIFKGGCRE
jgi:hypothetical protein